MIPWHSLKVNTVQLMFKLIERAIESLEFHLSRQANQIDKNLLSRLITTAQTYPAFSEAQREHFLNEEIKTLKLTRNSLISE